MDVGFEIESSAFSLGKLNRGHWGKAGFLGEYNLPPTSHPWNEGNLNEFPKVSGLPKVGRESTLKILSWENITYPSVFCFLRETWWIQNFCWGFQLLLRWAPPWREWERHGGSRISATWFPPRLLISGLPAAEGCQLNSSLSSSSTDPHHQSKSTSSGPSQMDWRERSQTVLPGTELRHPKYLGKWRLSSNVCWYSMSSIPEHSALILTPTSIPPTNSSPRYLRSPFCPSGSIPTSQQYPP